jgi:hypothetical protein
LSNHTQRIRYDQPEALADPKAAMARASMGIMGWGLSGLGKCVTGVGKGMCDLVISAIKQTTDHPPRVEAPKKRTYVPFTDKVVKQVTAPPSPIIETPKEQNSDIPLTGKATTPVNAHLSWEESLNTQNDIISQQQETTYLQQKVIIT